MNTYRNTKSEKGGEATRVVACQAIESPGANWEQVNESEIVGMTHLYTVAGVRYFGSL